MKLIRQPDPKSVQPPHDTACLLQFLNFRSIQNWNSAKKHKAGQAAQLPSQHPQYDSVITTRSTPLSSLGLSFTTNCTQQKLPWRWEDPAVEEAPEMGKTAVRLSWPNLKEIMQHHTSNLERGRRRSIELFALRLWWSHPAAATAIKISPGSGERAGNTSFWMDGEKLWWTWMSLFPKFFFFSLLVFLVWAGNPSFRKISVVLLLSLSEFFIKKY